jgi:Zn-dependent protease
MRGDEEVATYRVSYQPYEYYIEPPVREGGLKFSEEEKKHLLMAIGALTLAFTLLLFIHAGFSFLLAVIISFVAVCTAFLLHEFGHKIVAQRYGCWAEFRAWPFGLMFAVLSGLVGFLFAAPGAVYIRGHLSKEENGKVSASGPLMNFVVASFIMPFLFILRDEYFTIWFLLGLICFLNIFIAGFNMIPFPPLDGSKIMNWNPIIWVFLIIILGIFVALLYLSGILAYFI